MKFHILAAIVFSVSPLSCSSTTESEPYVLGSTFTSETQTKVTLIAFRKPLVRSVESFEVTFSGTNIPTQITAYTWMPAHNHAAYGQPKVTPLTIDRFRVENIGLSMPGTWQTEIELVGSKKEKVTFTYEVE